MRGASESVAQVTKLESLVSDNRCDTWGRIPRRRLRGAAAALALASWPSLRWPILLLTCESIALIMEERYFILSTPDDGMPTITSAEQENTEEACRDSLYDYADDDGKIDRES